jgi:selenocysteine-specific elongation factor
VTRAVLGVVGHVDHGKTTLVRALTGQETDRLPEEQRRGISIALGFAHMRAEPDLEVDLIDMPGHERFVRTMIAGATGVDAILLVVAANEGIKPQTIEHVDIAALLGLRRAVVAISKSDLVGTDQAERLALAIAQLLERRGLKAAVPVRTSLPHRSGIEALRQALFALAAEQRGRTSDGIVYLPVDRVFGVAGRGPVVTGTLRGAAIRTGDYLELLPAGRSVRIKGLEVHGMSVDTVSPGQRVALNLRDIELGQLHRGMALTAPDALESSEWLTISLRAVEHAPRLTNGMRLRALLGTAELDVRLRLLDRDVLEGSSACFAQLRVAEPVALPAGEHVILRLVSPPQTVAGGKVLEPVTRRQPRRSGALLQRLEDLRSLTGSALLAAEVERAGPAGVALRTLSRVCALCLPRLVEWLQALPVEITRSAWVVLTVHMDHLQSQIPRILSHHAQGLSAEKLQLALLANGAAVLEEALERLTAREVIAKRGGLYWLPRPSEDRARATQEAQLGSRIAETLRQAGLMPPSPSELVKDLSARRAVDRLLRAGIIVRAADRAKGRELLFHRDAIDEARSRLAPLLERPDGLLVTEVGAALGISRKYSMPLLEHLDATRFTRRINDRRVRGTAPVSPSRPPVHIGDQPP